MDADLVHDICSTSDCWDGAIRAAVPCRITAVEPWSLVEATLVPDLAHMYSASRFLPGLLLVTTSHVYLLAQVLHQQDAAVILEDQREAIVSVTETTPESVAIQLVDSRVVLALPQHARDKEALRCEFADLWWSGSPDSPDDQLPPPASAPPLPPPPLTSSSALYSTQMYTSAAALSETGSPDFRGRLSSVARSVTAAGGGGAPSASADYGAPAATELMRLRFEVEGLRASAAGSRAAAEMFGLEQAETQSRLDVTEDFYRTAVALSTAVMAAWRMMHRHETELLLADVKRVNCTTHTLQQILPDGEHTAHFAEEPSSSTVHELLDIFEKSARSQLDSYLTTSQLQARERRRKLEADMATRDIRATLTAESRELAAVRSELTALKAKCSDLESTVGAMATQLSDMESRERSVIDRARRREEDLHAALSKAQSGGDASTGTAAGRRAYGKPVQSFDFFAS